ncbi:hypothetical protein EH223_00685 [candidate division KSB1 bacterium]|nr:BamA/TamA family outer membrane protein [candidate division KSB1 bacterium]RQW07167.1 MAG: hypothetical protein EH223_00685 [candidate division KSB1 bacterium]
MISTHGLNFKRITLFLFFFLVYEPGFARSEDQHDNSLYQGKTISKIIIVGNAKTKDAVILREMKTKTGAHFDDDLVREDKKRIQNLLLFTRVEIYPAKDKDERVGLIIVVAERWPFFPYPLLFRNERSWALEKWSYGAGVIHNNIRGMNNKLLAEAWLGYNPGGVASYYNPWFGGDRQFYYKVAVHSMTIKSKTLTTLQRFDEFHRGFLFTFGKRWGYHTYSTVAVGYDYIRYPQDYVHLMPTEHSYQHLPSMGIGFQYDTRDLYEYPKEGWLLFLGLNNFYYPKELNYYQLGADVRRYFSLYKDLSLVFRMNTDLSFGDIPVFSHYYLGYSERIRGQFYDVMEGDSRLIFMMELRFPLLPIQYLDVDYGAAMFGQYSHDLPFGISGGVFYDVGAAWFKNEQNIPSNFLSGWGCGLHLHLPYIDVLRIEYGLNSNWQGQLIVDTQVAF